MLSKLPLVFNYPLKLFRRPTFLRPSQSTLSLAQLITYAHENLSEPSLLPRWKHQYTSQIVVVPTQLFLAEETDDLRFCGWSGRVAVEEEVVEERRCVVENRFRF
jgi:hypothetical protein